jgi:hypothetical protein
VPLVREQLVLLAQQVLQAQLAQPESDSLAQPGQLVRLARQALRELRAQQEQPDRLA